LTRAISWSRATTTTPTVSRKVPIRKPQFAVWDQRFSRHNHRARPIRSPAEQQNDASDSPRHASCTQHYNRRRTVQRLAITSNREYHADTSTGDRNFVPITPNNRGCLVQRVVVRHETSCHIRHDSEEFPSECLARLSGFARRSGRHDRRSNPFSHLLRGCTTRIQHETTRWATCSPVAITRSFLTVESSIVVDGSGLGIRHQ
jgi:hypothetical protein